MVPQFSQVIQGPVTGNNTRFQRASSVAAPSSVRESTTCSMWAYRNILCRTLPDQATVRLFCEEINDPNGPSEVKLQTHYALAVRLIRLFWPLLPPKRV